MKQVIFILFLIPFFFLGGLEKEVEATDVSTKSDELGEESKHVEVQHILISFKGAIPDDKVTRTREEAEALAKDLLVRAKAKEEFDALAKEFTDDQHPGIYRMSNTGIPPDSVNEEYSREKMVKAFGDVSFSLKVGEVGMAHYDPATSKYGWHIIKRLK